MDRTRQGLSQQQVLRQIQNLRQIQVARLLELPAQEIDRQIDEELEKNITLEAEEGADPSEGLQIELPGRILTRASKPEESSASEEEPLSLPLSDYTEGTPAYEREDFYGPYNYSPAQGLYENLISQLASFSLSPSERRLVEYLIYNLTPEGFLETPLEKLARTYTYQTGEAVSALELERLLKEVVQRLEPVGVGARNLLEALQLQVQALDPAEEPLKPVLVRLVTEFGSYLQAGQLERIRKRLKLDEETWVKALRRLASLDPRPGIMASAELPAEVTPDFVLHIEEGGSFRVELTYVKPRRLRIRRQYLELLAKLAHQKDPELQETYEELKKRIEAAKQFMENLLQRERTLHLTVEEIVRQQRAFFLSSCDDKKLKPLILEDVAKAVGVDISTVSRVVSSKYIQTPCGIFRLKHFFSEGVRTSSGGEVANKAVWGVIRELIAQENSNRPLSDKEITKRLHERGILVQRRTVAKYRQQMGIPSAAERKQQYRLRGDKGLPS